MITIKGAKYKGVITPPSSKSDAHRALICAALSNNATNLYNVDTSNDIEATLESLNALGANLTFNNHMITAHPISRKVDEATLQVNESGSTLRFLIPLSLILCSKAHFVLKGNLASRPINSFVEAFKNQNITIEKEENGYLVEGTLKSGIFEIDGSVSSQFISGLLFALPLLDGDSTIIIKNKISSLNYILMSINTLNKFNVLIDFDIKNQIIKIKGNQIYQGKDYIVESDYSQAAFFLALGAIQQKIEIKGLNLNSFQADKNILPILKKIGIKLRIYSNKIFVYPSKIKGSTISLDENPDLGPILIGLASFASSKTTFTNIQRLRIKESDRIEAMRYNLDLLGIKIEFPNDNTIIVYPGKITKPNKTLSSFHDHRIFMSLCIITSLLDEISIDDELCINKSYPNFLNDLCSLKEGS